MKRVLTQSTARRRYKRPARCRFPRLYCVIILLFKDNPLLESTGTRPQIDKYKMCIPFTTVHFGDKVGPSNIPTGMEQVM